MNPPPMDSHDDDDSSKDGSLEGDIHNSSANSDAEGVWSADIEQSFQEALAIYPPCGRRKIILSDEGKMYGRNELIARYIKLRTGKTRTRKQVSSHIQVLARRKAREIQSKLKKDHTVKEAALQSIQSMSSAQVVSMFYSSQDQAAKEKALQSLTTAQIASLQNIQNKSTPAHHHPAAPHHVSAATASHVASAVAGLASLGLAPHHATLPPHHQQFWQPAGAATQDDIKPFSELKNFNSTSNSLSNSASQYNNHSNNNLPAHEDRCIATHELRLCEFTAFMEIGSGAQQTKHIFVQIGGSPPSYSDPILEDIDIRQISDKFPQNKEGLKELYDKGPQNAFFLVKFWADLSIPQDLMFENAFYGVTAMFESTKNMVITCATKVCSFGKQVVEKVEVEYPTFENGRNLFRFERSPMCEYMINFIHKLKDLPEKYMMNSVLENFTILQLITNRETGDTLLCIAFVFEVSSSEHGAQHHIYRLTNNDN
ncbi:TEA domain transcription factor 1 homolog scalloped [Brevipalpus obovatus]|uniref:TEA domain transcription factor 1 homolog scalloped n=1 Tax=Brevipalpus obovatus TaxID=246614 RepID=UPI003D9F9D05